MVGAKSIVTGRVFVRPVSTRADRRRFVDLPYLLYRGCPNWIPPLRRDQLALIDPRRNAFFKHGRMNLYLADDERGRTVGRIAAIVNGQHLSRHGDRTGFVGFLEHAEDSRVAGALLDAACAWLREAGLARAIGPVNPTLNDTSGCLVRGFDSPPSIMMPYNLPHHEPAYLAAGFRRAMTQWQYFGHWKHLDRTRLERGLAAVRRRYPDVRIRRADARRFDQEVPALRDLYVGSFAEAWGFVPPTEDEFLQMARAMRPIVDDRIVFILEKAGRPIGFSLSLPNVNQILKYVPNGRLFPWGLAQLYLRSWLGHISEFRTVLLGVLPEYRRRGLDAFLVLSTIDEGRRAGYAAAQLGWVADDNVVLRNALARLGAVVDKEYALFERSL